MRHTLVAAVVIAGMLLTGCGGLMKAHMKLGSGAYDEAIPLYEQYLAENPSSTEAHSRLGFAYLKTGRLDQAVEALETALRQSPGDPYAVLYLGLAHINREEYGKALEVWKGYRNQAQPLVEEEIRRQMTLLQIAESQRQAKQALAREEQLQAGVPPDNTIAVFYYRDLTADNRLAAFQKGLAAMIISDLAKIRSLKVVERVRLQALLQEMKLGQTGIVDTRSAPRVGRLLGARNVVVGSLDAGSITVTTSVNDETSAVTVDEADFWQIPIFAVRTAAQALGLALSPAEQAAVGEPHTKNLKAFTYYGQALMAQDAGRWQDAKDLFDKALKEDPAFGLAGEGAEGNPGPGAPGIGALADMPAAAVAGAVESSIGAAETAQAEADQEAAEAAQGGGGGGGG